MLMAPLPFSRLSAPKMNPQRRRRYVRSIWINAGFRAG